jgi:hypothetical protein
LAQRSVKDGASYEKAETERWKNNEDTLLHVGAVSSVFDLNGGMHRCRAERRSA